MYSRDDAARCTAAARDVNVLPWCDWCTRYAAHFTAVGAAFDATARVNAARFSAVGVGVMLPILLLLVPVLKLRLG